MSSNGAVVTATDLSRRYGEGEATVDALQGVNLSVQTGELVAVMGPSGSGKSTLLHLIGGLDRPDSGEVLIEGETLSSLSDDALAHLDADIRWIDLTLARLERLGKELRP